MFDLTTGHHRLAQLTHKGYHLRWLLELRVEVSQPEPQRRQGQGWTLTQEKRKALQLLTLPAVQSALVHTMDLT